MPTKIKPEPILLNYADSSGRPVVITPKNEDRLVYTVQQAATACQMAENACVFGLQFERRLLPKLASWLAEHDVCVRKAFLTIRDRDLLFVVIKKTAAYDRDFEDELSELDLDIAQDPQLHLISLDCLCLPDASDAVCSSFLSPEMLVEFRRGK